jgi:hypothetical protein
MKIMLLVLCLYSTSIHSEVGGNFKKDLGIYKLGGIINSSFGIE